jgi:RNA polymerase sigma-70 factor (ECF subfamily)
LFAYARNLTRNAVDAEDLLQATVARALGRADLFRPDTNITGWLKTMMVNLWRSGWASRFREVEDADGQFAERVEISGGQFEAVVLHQAERVMAGMPDQFRSSLERLLMGDTVAEIAAHDGVPIGTVKSRATRARAILFQEIGR